MDRLLKIVFLLFMVTLSISCKNNHSNIDHDHKNHDHSNEKSYYTCSMHPQIKESKPGKCPICHMSLTKVEIDDEDDDQISFEHHEKDLWQCKSVLRRNPQ